MTTHPGKTTALVNHALDQLLKSRLPIRITLASASLDRSKRILLAFILAMKTRGLTPCRVESHRVLWNGHEITASHWRGQENANTFVDR